MDNPLIVNHKHRFIFYHVPKAAGTSIRTALAGLQGSRKPRGTKHWLPREYEERQGWLGRLRSRNHFTFCFVRDPFERFGSGHRYARQIGKPLPADVNDAAEMLLDGRLAAMNLRFAIPQVEFARGLSFIGRHERLETDFAEICRRIGIILPLPELNASGPSVIYRESFTPRTIDILRQVYAEDFAELGY